jgi:hypothetical protein
MMASKNKPVLGDENYKQMSAEEQARIKSIHKAIRAETATREGNLAWAFVRGLAYRRVERATRTQVMPDGSIVHHNKPSAAGITTILGKHIPGFAEVDPSRPWRTKANADVIAWLANPEGAIPAPPPREKVLTRGAA